jgi:hypothetical protein
VFNFNIFICFIQFLIQKSISSIVTTYFSHESVIFPKLQNSLFIVSSDDNKYELLQVTKISILFWYFDNILFINLSQSWISWISSIHTNIFHSIVFSKNFSNSSIDKYLIHDSSTFLLFVYY